MKIKIKIMLENLTPDKQELATYLIDCLAQREFGHNIELTTNKDAADIFIDVKDLKSKEEIIKNLHVFAVTIMEKLFDKRPVVQRGQKKLRRKNNR